MKNLKALALAVVALAAMPLVANAHLITPLGIPAAGNDDAAFFNGLPGIDDVELLFKLDFKENKTDGVLVGGGYFTIDNVFLDEDNEVASADVSWNLAGSGYELLFVAWKGGNGFLYSGVSDDQAIVGGPHEVAMSPGGSPAISHISFYGKLSTRVPDAASTLALLGLGLVALVGVRNRFGCK